MRESFRVGERDVLAVLRETRIDMIADLLKRLSAGKITARNLDGIRRSKFKGMKGALGALGAALTSVGEAGMGHVTDELDRQEMD